MSGAGRVTLNDTLTSAVVKMSEGNPGACTVLGQLANIATEVDPDSVLGPLGPVLQLDTLEIYGSRIWQFYKDVCKQDTRVLIALLRARQLGFVTSDELKASITNPTSVGDGIGLDVDELVGKVEQELPNFKRAEEVK